MPRFEFWKNILDAVGNRLGTVGRQGSQIRSYCNSSMMVAWRWGRGVREWTRAKAKSLCKCHRLPVLPKRLYPSSPQTGTCWTLRAVWMWQQQDGTTPSGSLRLGRGPGEACPRLGQLHSQTGRTEYLNLFPGTLSTDMHKPTHTGTPNSPNSMEGTHHRHTRSTCLICITIPSNTILTTYSPTSTPRRRPPHTWNPRHHTFSPSQTPPDLHLTQRANRYQIHN